MPFGAPPRRAGLAMSYYMIRSFDHAGYYETRPILMVEFAAGKLHYFVVPYVLGLIHFPENKV